MEHPYLKFSKIGVKQGIEPIHYHDDDELYISLGGKAVNIVNGTKKTALAGDVYVLTPDMIHEQRDINNYKYCLFKFNRKLLITDERLLKLPGFFRLFVLEPQQEVFSPNLCIDKKTADYAAIVAEILKNDDDSFVSQLLFLSMIALICKNCTERTPSITQTDHVILSEAVSFMETNYQENISLEMLTEKTHYSKRHFTRLFKTYYDASPMEFLGKIRLYHAADMLVSTAKSITEIAVLCGFYDSSIMGKRFKKYYGLSPREYRSTQAKSRSPEHGFKFADIKK